MNRKVALQSAEVLFVSLGAAMGIGALAALPWYLITPGIGMTVGAWGIVYKIMMRVKELE